jgi:hypothetical protein
MQVALHMHLDQSDLALEACENAKASLLHTMIADSVDVKASLSGIDSLAFDDTSKRLRIAMHRLDSITGDENSYDDNRLASLAIYTTARGQIEMYRQGD